MSIWFYIVTESICTHYSNLSGQPDIFLGSAGSGTVQKLGTPCFAKSSVQKNRVPDPKVPDPKKISCRPDKLE